MKIKKLGHCCLVIEVNGKRVITDPGSFSTLQKDEKYIDLILYTHEHGDHYHLESLKEVLENNPSAKIVTNSSVGKLLTEVGLEFTKIEDGESLDFYGVNIKGFGNLHAEIYESIGRVQNTGYMIDGLCFPGDALENPNCPVDILALPVAGPWMRMKDALEYAKNIKPRIIFPIHDGFINELGGFIKKWPETVLTPLGMQYKVLQLGKEEDL